MHQETRRSYVTVCALENFNLEALNLAQLVK